MNECVFLATKELRHPEAARFHQRGEGSRSDLRRTTTPMSRRALAPEAADHFENEFQFQFLRIVFAEGERQSGCSQDDAIRITRGE
jgi:hypothetical protein